MTVTRRPRPAQHDRELRLWRVGRALAVTFAAAVLAAGGVFYGLIVLLHVQKVDSTAKLDANTLFDLLKLSFGVVAGTGALVALVVAYRRQRVDEAGAHRDATRLHTERFTTAVSQLGDDSPAVRLGGVHALAGLADDAPDDGLRQTCIDVLCTYLQLPFTADPGTDPAHQTEHHHYLALRKVRHTILRLIGDHYRRPQGTHRSWQGCDLDLTGVTIDGDMDFGGAVFSGGSVSFATAAFSGGTVSFGGAVFSGGPGYTHSSVSFDGATFSGGSVSFGGARFSGSPVTFNDATFSSGIVTFEGATFSNSAVAFAGAAFSGGTVSFGGAVFSGGTVSFADATFSGGAMLFGDAAFSGSPVTFLGATFSGGFVLFGDAVFSGGIVVFAGATFSGGTVTFGGAVFSGSTVIFNALFSDGAVTFANATFFSGRIDFRNAQGTTPEGLLTMLGTPTPPSVALPPPWLLSGS
ncbi:pentapeptide repeat-containing protein [Streptomyces sp. NPDC001073]